MPQWEQVLLLVVGVLVSLFIVSGVTPRYLGVATCSALRLYRSKDELARTWL